MLCSKRGIFWTFGTGEDVAVEWITFAKEAEGNKKGFAERVLHHVGFEDIELDKYRFHMVAFDISLMDAAWAEIDGGQAAFKPTWNNTFDYLGNGFTVSGE